MKTAILILATIVMLGSCAKPEKHEIVQDKPKTTVKEPKKTIYFPDLLKVNVSQVGKRTLRIVTEVPGTEGAKLITVRYVEFSVSITDGETNIVWWWEKKSPQE